MCYACGQKIKAEEEAAEAPQEDAASSEEDEIPCPNCRTMISKDAVMCYACGVNLKEALAAAEAKGAPVEGEKATEIKKPQIFVKKIVKKKTA
jgi:hypothetical protein